MNVPQIVEAVLFASDAPLTADEIARADEQLDEDRVEEALQLLHDEYDDSQRAFELVEVAEGYQVLTRPEYAPYLDRFDNVPRSARLSGPAIETLAIIAYRQPLGRLEVEYIRGVSASGVIRTLQERRLIDVVARGEGLGRPLLYGTTTHFLEHFGFKSLEGLPRPEELPIILRQRHPLGTGDLEDPGEEGQQDDGQESLALGEGEAGGEDADDAGSDAAAEPDVPAVTNGGDDLVEEPSAPVDQDHDEEDEPRVDPVD